MAEKIDFPILVEGFSSIKNSSDETTKLRLWWYCAPDSWKDTLIEGRREGRDGSWNIDHSQDNQEQLVVKPAAKKDFWRNTYYSPILVKDDASCLFATVPKPSNNQAITVETCFTIKSTTCIRQFDQAGICIRIDSKHWLKTGIEVVDDIPRLSCVCTNVYSDWSTQRYWKIQPELVRIRVHLLPNNSLVVEAFDERSNTWSFIRICHLSKDTKVEPDPLEHIQSWTGKDAGAGEIFVGLFAACPEDQTGTFITFHDFKIMAGSEFKHNADGNQEE